jgi:TolA-binding protein
MRTMKNAGAVISFVAVFALGSLPAQKVPVSKPGTSNTANTSHKEPCWQQAGISKSAIAQVHQIQESTRSQVESVCSNSSLSPQQKQQEIRQLHQQAHQRIEGLVGAQQAQAFRTCQEQRGHVSGGMHQGSPCENIAGNTGQPATPVHP